MSKMPTGLQGAKRDNDPVVLRAEIDAIREGVQAVIDAVGAQVMVDGQLVVRLLRPYGTKS